MTTENSEHGGFFANNNPSLGHIAASDHPDPGIAMVDLDGPGTIYLYTPAKARELLAAAFDAVKFLDPAGAPDALLALIEDGLATILARANEEDIREALAAREPGPELAECATCHLIGTPAEMNPVAYKVLGTGEAELRWYCRDIGACNERAVPGLAGALKASLAARACAACGDTEAPLDEQVGVPGEPVVLRCHNRPNCQRRQAAKAGALNG